MIYKYMSIYGIDVLVNSRIKLTKVAELNDPYECSLIKNGLFSKELVEYEINRNYNIASFSKDRNNLPLWAHYADNHAGLCIGFDNNSIEIVDKIREVEYCKDRLSEVELEKLSVDEKIWRLATRKSCAWKYENEIRILSKNEFIVLNKDCIKEIIIGHKMSDQFRKIIYKIWMDCYASSGTKIFEAKLDNKYFSLKYAEIEKYDINYGIIADNNNFTLSVISEAINKSKA